MYVYIYISIFLLFLIPFRPKSYAVSDSKNDPIEKLTGPLGNVQIQTRSSMPKLDQSPEVCLVCVGVQIVKMRRGEMRINFMKAPKTHELQYYSNDVLARSIIE